MASVNYEVQRKDTSSNAGVGDVDIKLELAVISRFGCRPREGILRETRVAARRRLLPR
jgi:hypothetical protein